MNAVTEATETAARMADSIVALPPLPVTAQKILTCFGDEFIDADKVGEVVESDPGICAKLLGLANSAYFGLAEPLYDIREAISRVLGVDTVRSLVLAMAIQQSFNSRDCPAFDVERFWTRSLFVAECCKKIAMADQAADEADRDLSYSAGLCHNLGMMALAHMEPERTSGVLVKHQAGQELRPVAELFAEEFGTDHKLVTAQLAQSWSLPAPMMAAYEFRALADSDSDVRLAYIVAAGIAAVENAGLDQEDRVSLLEFAEALGIGTEELQDMAVMGERQEERVQSLASNMAR